MSEIDLKKITTEGRNQNTLDIDQISTIDILKEMNKEDKTVAYAVEVALPQIAFLVDALTYCFKQDGRLIYVGAGTSGRIGLMDAVECHPTFSCSFDMVQALMAGGDGAMVQAVEGAEDDEQMAINQLKAINLKANDCVIGIAASGRTPYTISAVKYANEVGCATGCITTSKNSKLAEVAKFPIEAITGSEVVMGSTRLKSGTAQKLICNMLTTASMIKLGKTYSNLLIEMLPTNEKVHERCKNVLVEALDITKDEATFLLDKYGTMKKAIFASLSGIENISEIERLLDLTKGNIRESLKLINQ